MWGDVWCRLFSIESAAGSTPDSSKARISPLKSDTPNLSRTGESAASVFTAADSPIERRRSSVDTSVGGLGGVRSSGAVMSADRPQHSATSRPGRDGIKLNSDAASRVVSLLKKQDAVSSEFRPNVQGLNVPHSYVDKFSEFLFHGKWIIKFCKCAVFCKHWTTVLQFFLPTSCVRSQDDVTVLEHLESLVIL